MKANITDLLSIFDELDEFATNEELGVYWFRFTRADKLTISLSFSIYECYVDTLVYIRDQVTVSDINMKNCSEIRILDESKKCLEIIHDDNKGRCFLHLTGDSIVTYEE